MQHNTYFPHDTRHHTELEAKMLVPAHEINRFNFWASIQMFELQDTPSEMYRLEAVLYGIPITARLTKDDYLTAVESARMNPNVPMSVYSAFKSNFPKW